MRSVTACAVLAFLLLAGCGPPLPPEGFWKLNGTYDEWTADRYECLKEARGPYSSAAVNAYGGYASGGLRPSLGMYKACMTAKGWDWVQGGFTGQVVNFAP